MADTTMSDSDSDLADAAAVNSAMAGLAMTDPATAGSGQGPPILKLPGELIQHIAIEIESDASVVAFARTCRWIALQLLSPSSGIWRGRFSYAYDGGWRRPSHVLKYGYQLRAFLLKQRVFVQPKITKREHMWLEVIFHLLHESYAPNKNGVVPSKSKNLEKVTSVVRQSDFLRRPMVWSDRTNLREPTPLFCAVQLMLTHLSLSPIGAGPCARNTYEIAKVFSYPSEAHIPLVQAGQVQLETLLHVRNFWQRHLLSMMERSYASSYLGSRHRPLVWDRPLQHIRIPLPSNWLGYHTSISPSPQTLRELEDDQTSLTHERFPNMHPNDNRIMHIKLYVDNEVGPWPYIFNMMLPVMHELHQRVMIKGFMGWEEYDDLDPYDMSLRECYVRGFMQVVPTPQGGVPGWTRICFVRYLRALTPMRYPEDTGASFFIEELAHFWPPDDVFDDYYILNGFEGIILPGGKIMVGQHFNMQQEGNRECERGPFIYWAVKPPRIPQHSHSDDEDEEDDDGEETETEATDETETEESEESEETEEDESEEGDESDDA